MKNIFKISTVILLIISTFFIHSCNKDKPALPNITTTEITSITSTTAVSGGIITSDNGGAVTARGVCWDTAANPTIANSKTTDSTGTGIFTSSITGLTLGNTYYVRAYAINSAGPGYGNEVIFTTALAIGESYQAGIIAYILQPGDQGYILGQAHGLIAAQSDQSTLIAWWNGSYTTAGAIGSVLGTGNANTNTIVRSQGEGIYAAKLCYDLVLGGYSDWYLPSKDELNKFYLNKAAIGGFANDVYWSSTEFNFAMVWFQNFNDGFQEYGHKSFRFCVRAVQAF